MSDDHAFFRLSDRLSELQMALAERGPEDGMDRIERASRLRMALWEAIADYRDHWVDLIKGR